MEHANANEKPINKNKPRKIKNDLPCFVTSNHYQCERPYRKAIQTVSLSEQIMEQI